MDNDETRSGIELIHFHGGPGCEDEELQITNGLTNGLRILISNDDMDWASFHIHSRETARSIAEKLIEWSERIGEPDLPHQPDDVPGP